MEIREDDVTGAEVLALLQDHAALMESWSPPDACHYFDAEALRQPSVTFWSLWDGGDLVGCGALQEHSASMGEIKSMHTRPAHRGKGAGRMMLEHVLAEARRRGYDRLGLETGPQTGFDAARALYAAYGFRLTGPFGDYEDNANSVFMQLDL